MSKMKPKKKEMVEIWKSKTVESIVNEVSEYLCESFNTLYEVLQKDGSLGKHDNMELSCIVLSSILEEAMKVSRNDLQPKVLAVISEEMKVYIEGCEFDDGDDDCEMSHPRKKAWKKKKKKTGKRFEEAFMEFMEDMDQDNLLSYASKEIIGCYEDIIDNLDG